jgi:hypothetical protein
MNLEQKQKNSSLELQMNIPSEKFTKKKLTEEKIREKTRNVSSLKSQQTNIIPKEIICTTSDESTSSLSPSSSVLKKPVSKTRTEKRCV